MNIREKQEKWEKDYLSPYASLSQNSLGRDRQEAQCDIRRCIRETETGFFIPSLFGG